MDVDYNFSVSIPANTAESAAVSEDLKLTHGVVTEVRIGFPDGCADLVKVQIWRDGHQLWPTNPDGAYSWNDYVFEIKEAYELFDVPLTLRVRAWNLDQVNEHKVMVGVNLLPAEPGYLARVVQAVMGRPRRLGGL